MSAIAMLAQLSDLFGVMEWTLILIVGISCPLLGFLVRRLRGRESSFDLTQGLELYYLVSIPMIVLIVTKMLPETFCVLLPIALASVPFGLAIAFGGERRLPSGICSKCEYDLTGNVSGICPECGTAVAGRAASEGGGFTP